MVENIQFGNKNTYKDYKLLIQSLTISTAEPKEELVEIPGMDGSLDFSESLSGDIKYKNRTISISLAKYKNKNCLNEYSQIQNDLHGRTMKIILSDEPNFFYYGRIKVKDYDKYSILHTIDIECDVEPYKYDLYSSNEDWLWDPFNFENGIINETKDLEVNGELEITVYGRRKRVVPKFNCKIEDENSLELIFNGQTYNLSDGTNYSPDIEICEGENVLKFVGNGTVTIEYRGGSL